MIWIVTCGAPQNALPKRCTGEAFEKAMAALPEAAVVPWTGRTMKAVGRRVYYAPGRRAAETAAQAAPEGARMEEPLLASQPLRAWTDAAGEKPLALWRFMARRQAAKGDPRQPESRKALIARAEELIRRLEKSGEDCVLVPGDELLPILLDRFRLHSYSQRRSGFGRVRPFEQFMLTPRVLHCGGCSHNCLLSNPGCGIGRDKAMRMKQAGNHTR